MQELIQQIVSGLADGAVYASLALALVLIYSAMGLVNFAQGEFAMFSAFIAWLFLTTFHLPYGLAVVLALAAGFAGAVLIERTVVRPFERGPQVNLVIVTLALFTIVNGAAGFLFGYAPQSFPSAFPSRDLTFAGIFLSISDVGVIGVSLLVLVLMSLFLNLTPLGLALRAAAQYPDSSRLLGIRVGWMLALGWGLAAAVGAVAGILYSSSFGFIEPNVMQGVIIYAFAAAVLGGIDSPPGAVIGGLLLGVVLALIGAYIPLLAPLRLPLALLLIVALLVVRPSGLLGRRHAVVRA